MIRAAREKVGTKSPILMGVSVPFMSFRYISNLRSCLLSFCCIMLDALGRHSQLSCLRCLMIDGSAHHLKFDESAH